MFVWLHQKKARKRWWWLCWDQFINGNRQKKEQKSALFFNQRNCHQPIIVRYDAEAAGWIATHLNIAFEVMYKMWLFFFCFKSCYREQSQSSKFRWSLTPDTVGRIIRSTNMHKNFLIRRKVYDAWDLRKKLQKLQTFGVDFMYLHKIR